MSNKILVLVVSLVLVAFTGIIVTSSEVTVEDISLDLPAEIANPIMELAINSGLHPAYQATWSACEVLPSWGGIDQAVEESITNLLTTSFEVADKFVR